MANLLEKFGICMTIVSIIFLNSIYEAKALADDARIAELKKDLDAKIGKEAIATCKNNLFERYDLELVEFLEFIDLNFQNKSANSELVNIAISRYAEYKNNLTVIFSKIVPSSNVGGLTAAELTAYFDCSKIKDSYLELAKKQMIDHIKNTNAQKKATIMVEKYKAINNRLRDLNFSIARMYGYFVTFGDKLPFFIKNCQKK